MAHCLLCERLERIISEAPPFVSPWRDGLEEVAALIPGDLAVNTARVRQSVLKAVRHTGVKQETIECALYQYLSTGERFEDWLASS